jgi:TolB-like protein
MGAHLTEAGYRVLDSRLQSRIFVKKGEGEFLLSREVREASRSYNASAVLVGTYAVAEETVLVSARLVRSRDSLVLAATNFTLPKTREIQSLLGGF